MFDKLTVVLNFCYITAIKMSSKKYRRVQILESSDEDGDTIVDPPLEKTKVNHKKHVKENKTDKHVRETLKSLFGDDTGSESDESASENEKYSETHKIDKTRRTEDLKEIKNVEHNGKSEKRKHSPKPENLSEDETPYKKHKTSKVTSKERRKKRESVENHDKFEKTKHSHSSTVRSSEKSSSEREKSYKTHEKSYKPSEKQAKITRVVPDNEKWSIYNDIRSALMKYEVNIEMYAKLSPLQERNLKEMSFLLLQVYRDYNRVEEAQRDYEIYKSRLRETSIFEDVSKASTMKEEVMEEREIFIQRLKRKGRKFLSFLKDILSVFDQDRKALFLVFTEVVKESKHEIPTKEYVEVCRSLVEKMLVQNHCTDYAFIFTRMHFSYFFELFKKALSLSQSRPVGSTTPMSSTSCKTDSLNSTDDIWKG